MTQSGLSRALRRLRDSFPEDREDFRKALRRLLGVLEDGGRELSRRLQPFLRKGGRRLHDHLGSLSEELGARNVADQLAGTSWEVPSRDHPIHRLSAAYSSDDRFLGVVGDLVRAGVRPEEITVIRPVPTSVPDDTRTARLVRRLDRPLRHPLARGLAEMTTNRGWWPPLGALLMGTIMSVGALVVLGPDYWLAFAGLGIIAGVVSGVVASAMGAWDSPRLAPEYLGAADGAVTVEVETSDPSAARAARELMLRHRPERLQPTTWLPPNPPIWHELPARPGRPARRPLPDRPRPSRIELSRRRSFEDPSL